MKLIMLLLCTIAYVYASIDDRTSPGAFSIAQAYNNALATSKKNPKCPFPKEVECASRTKYRSFDGTCNNLHQPLYGSLETPHKRILNPIYDDGQGTPRTKAVSGKTLPNPRLISTTIQSDNNVFEGIWTHIFVIFGQFLTHDILATAQTNRNDF